LRLTTSAKIALKYDHHSNTEVRSALMTDLRLHIVPDNRYILK